MENIILKELVKSTKGNLVFGHPKQPVFSLSTDTRKIHRGDIFFALSGKNYDGHQFAIHALELGGQGLVVSRLPDGLDKFFPALPVIVTVKDTLQALGDFAKYYRRKFSPKVIAVSGSNGKTTTKEMIFSILDRSGTSLANFGSYNNLIGLPLTLFNLGSEHKYCILELGTSIPGEITRLGEICQPDIGVLTNIGHTHLEFLDNIDGVFREKQKLVTSLQQNGTAVLNIDDRYLRRLISKPERKVVTYGLSDEADIYATNIVFWPDKPKFDLHLPKESISVQLPVYGQFNVYNALAASAVACSLGIDIKTIRRGLEEFNIPGMRMEIIKLRSDTIIVNDTYNANPESMKESILSFVRTYPEKTKIVVIGDMLELGKSSEREHILLGEFIATLPVRDVFVYGNNAQFVFTGIKNKNPEHVSINIAYEPEELIDQLKSKIESSQAILFKASRAVGLEKIIERL